MRRIGLYLGNEPARARTLLRGIVRFARPYQLWLFHTNSGQDWNLDVMAAWRPEGLIADLAEPRIAERLLESGVPVVDVAQVWRGSTFQYIGTDHEAVGRAAAEHLTERGYRHLAYFGRLGWEECGRQLQGIQRLAQQRGCTVTAFDPTTVPKPDTRHGWTISDSVLPNWLRGLPKPCGVVIYDDELGIWLTQACMVAGLRVPDQVALIGVNDNSLNCEMTYPTLSSVQTPIERIGYEAAAQLERLLAGQTGAQNILLPPSGVTSRGSTAQVAIGDADVALAVRFIREHAEQRMDVSDVLAAVPLSRRVLEIRFRRMLGCTPLEQIRRAHVDRAKHLLRTTEAPLRVIAEKSGFAHLQHLSNAFRRETGQTPGQYRRQLPRRMDA